MIALGDVFFRQRGDGHRRLALPVDLRQPRPEAVERGQRILDIHRRAAPDQRADVFGVDIGRTGDQALDHGRRGEHRHARPGIEQRDNLLRLEAAAFGDDLHAEPRHVLHDVDAGAVAHRRGVQDGVARRHRIDLAAIGQTRSHEIVVREHGALRPPGGARGVEQPGQIVARACNERRRIGGKQRLVAGAADGDQVFERFGRVRRDVGIEALGGKADARARLLQDVAELGAVQLGIGRHRGEPCVPDAVKQFEIMMRILGGDGDPLAGRQAELLAQGAGQPRGACRQLSVGCDHARAGRRRRPRRVTESGAGKPRRDVHDRAAVRCQTTALSQPKRIG